MTEKPTTEKSTTEKSTTEKPTAAPEARLPKPLTAREARFVESYRLHGIAARAARDAGYAGHQAGAIGWMTLRRPKVLAALKALGMEIVLTPKKTSGFQSYTKTYKRKGMTLLQERFVAQYLIDGNSTQSAIRAGLTGNPMRAGVRMLKNRKVARAIQRERAAAAARLMITAERVLGEEARIAFADIGDVADWGPQGVTLKEKADLSPHDRAAIAELRAETSGEKDGARRIRVKMHSKQHALEALGKHLGLWGKGAKTIARASAEELAAERKSANDELRERLLRIARAGGIAVPEKKTEEEEKT